MAGHICRFCEERPDNFLITDTTSGDTGYVCIPCLPAMVAAIFESVGLPGLMFDFPEEGEGAPEAIAETPLPDPATTASEGPGVLEEIEKAERLPQAVSGDRRGRKSEANGKAGSHEVEEAPSAASVDPG